jgi:hypothetical protein
VPIYRAHRRFIGLPGASKPMGQSIARPPDITDDAGENSSIDTIETSDTNDTNDTNDMNLIGNIQ